MMDSNYLQAFKETKRYFKTNIFPLKLIPASSDKKIIFIQLQTKCNQKKNPTTYLKIKAQQKTQTAALINSKTAQKYNRQ